MKEKKSKNSSRLRGDKKGMMALLGVAGVVALIVIAAVLVINKVDYGGGKLSVANDPGESSPPNSPGCTIDTSVVTTFSSYDKYDSGIPVAGNHKYRVSTDKGKTWSGYTTVANAGSANLGGGNYLEVLFNDGNETYPNQIVKKEVACATTDSVIANPELNVANDTAIAVTCFDTNGNPIDGVDTNQTIGSGQSKTLRCQIEGSAKKGTREGVLVAEFSNAVYSKENLVVSGDVSGIATAPTHIVSDTANTVKAFTWSGTEGGVIDEFFVTVPAKDGQNPGDTQDVSLYLYPVNSFIEEDLSGDPLVTAVEDLDGNAQGIAGGMLLTTIHVN